MSTVTIHPEDYQDVLRGKGFAHGIEIELSLSAYDVPRKVEGKLDKATGIFHIFFEYLDQEEAIPRKLDEDITVKVGKNSGKVLGFEIQTQKRGIRQVGLQITKAVEKEIPRLAKFNQKANFRVVGSVLDRNRDSIFSEAVIPR